MNAATLQRFGIPALSALVAGGVYFDSQTRILEKEARILELASVASKAQDAERAAKDQLARAVRENTQNIAAASAARAAQQTAEKATAGAIERAAKEAAERRALFVDTLNGTKADCIALIEKRFEEAVTLIDK